MTAIKAARMLDVSQGRIIVNPVIVIRGDKVVSAGPNGVIPANAKIIDLGDVTLLPGLIDAHTHITYHFDEDGMFGLTADASPDVTLKYSEENARRTLEAGFTTIRNLGDSQGVDLRLRDEINHGDTPGPRMIVSGMALTPDMLGRAKGSRERIEAIQQFVNRRIDEGVDVIKLFEVTNSDGRPALSAEEVRAAVDLAHKAGRKVSVHAHEASSVIAAVQGGCDSIEHGTFLNEEAVNLLVKNHVPLVPTLYLPTHYIEHRKQFQFESSTWDFFETLRSRNLDNTRRALSKGVRIVSGSDAVAGLHGQNAREIIWLIKAGLKPADALRAATLDAAALLGLEGQVGDLKSGYFADIIAVPSDPLRNIAVLERVAFVMKSGRVIKSNL